MNTFEIDLLEQATRFMAEDIELLDGWTLDYTGIGYFSISSSFHASVLEVTTDKDEFGDYVVKYNLVEKFEGETASADAGRLASDKSFAKLLS